MTQLYAVYKIHILELKVINILKLQGWKKIDIQTVTNKIKQK